MKNRALFLLLFSFSLVFFASCEKDEDDPQANYEFLDQDLQGEFEGAAWTYNTGKVEVNYWDDTELDFEITALSSDDPCTDNFLAGDVILFSLPDSVGLYELSFFLQVMFRL